MSCKKTRHHCSIIGEEASLNSFSWVRMRCWKIQSGVNVMDEFDAREAEGGNQIESLLDGGYFISFSGNRYGW